MTRRTAPRPFHIVTALNLALVVLSTPTAAQDLDDIERAIVTAVESSADDAIALLERTVNMNSGTMNFAGVRAVGDVMLEEFRRLGFEVEWRDGTSWDRAGHVVARA